MRPERVQMLHNVFHQGGPATDVFVVASGALKVRRAGAPRLLWC